MWTLAKEERGKEGRTGNCERQELESSESEKKHSGIKKGRKRNAKGKKSVKKEKKVGS